MSPRRLASPAAVTILLLLCVAVGFVREFSLDFHWHLVVGRDVLGGSLGRRDTLSHTFAGQPVFVSSWLADALLALTFGAGGYAACAALRAACLVAALGLSVREMSRRGLPVWAGAALASLALAPLAFRFYLRPEMFAFAAFAGLLHLLGAHERSPRAWHLPASLGLIGLWVNLHGSVGIGLLAVGLYAVEAAARRRREPRVALGLLALPLAAFAVACLNPEGVRAPLAFRILSPTWVAHISEWQPLAPAAVPAPLVALAALAVVATVAAGRRTSPWRAALTIALTLLALRYARFLTFAVLAALPHLGGDLVAAGRRLAAGARGATWRRAGHVLAVFALGWALAEAGLGQRLHREIGVGLDPAFYPVAACAHARASQLQGRMLNSYLYGSYLLHCLPGTPVAIDQRAWSLYPDAFYRRTLDAGRSREAARAFADELGATWAFLAYDPLAARLGEDRERWRLLYFDDLALILVRADTAPAARAFGRIAPDRLVELTELRGGELEAARSELAVQLDRCPGCRRTQEVRAALAVAAGDDAELRGALDRLLPRETAEVAFLAGRHALRRGEHRRAAVLFGRFGELGGDPLVAALLQAEALARGGAVAEARRTLEAAARLPGGAAPAARARAALLGERSGTDRETVD